MREQWHRQAMWILLTCGLFTAACTSSGAPASSSSQTGSASQVITIASFNFPESEVLAQIYGQALRAKGYRVDVLAGVGARELLEPALQRGLVDFIPEYGGSALTFLSLGQDRGSSDVMATHRVLEDVLLLRGAAALDPAPAQDANAIVVTEDVSARYGLRSISDLASVAPQLKFGGTPECPQREFCLLGLRHTYGLRFGQFMPLDTGGPLTRQALMAHEIDVALLFTTDPHIATDHLVVLADDRGLQPAENVTPVVRRAILDRYGPPLVAVVDGVSALLTTDDLRALDASVAANGATPAVAAGRWLLSKELLGAGA